MNLARDAVVVAYAGAQRHPSLAGVLQINIIETSLAHEVVLAEMIVIPDAEHELICCLHVAARGMQ